MIDLQAVEKISNPKSEYWPYQKVPELDSKKFLLDENFLQELNFWLKLTFFETRKEKKVIETEQTWGSRLECLNISMNWMKIVQGS